MLIIFSIISTLFSASLTMSMSFVEAEVDYAENDSVKESLADDEDDNSLYHYKNKKIIVKTDIFFPFVSLFLQT